MEPYANPNRISIREAVELVHRYDASSTLSERGLGDRMRRGTVQSWIGPGRRRYTSLTSLLVAGLIAPDTYEALQPAEPVPDFVPDEWSGGTVVSGTDGSGGGSSATAHDGERRSAEPRGAGDDPNGGHVGPFEALLCGPQASIPQTSSGDEGRDVAAALPGPQSPRRALARRVRFGLVGCVVMLALAAGASALVAVDRPTPAVLDTAVLAPDHLRIDVDLPRADQPGSGRTSPRRERRGDQTSTKDRRAKPTRSDRRADGGPRKPTAAPSAGNTVSYAGQGDPVSAPPGTAALTNVQASAPRESSNRPAAARSTRSCDFPPC